MLRIGSSIPGSHKGAGEMCDFMEIRVPFCLCELRYGSRLV